jgi:hypothetical protein
MLKKQTGVTALGSTSNLPCIKRRIGLGKRGRESLFGSAANNREQKNRLQREINATDRQIDQLVYELYGLTAWIGDLA